MTTAATEVKERPVIFSGPMIRAILEGRKTQTRRVIKLDKYSNWQVLPESSNGTGACVLAGSRDLTTWIECPYGQIGDRIWVRENAYISDKDFGYPEDATCKDNDGDYRVVGYSADMNWDGVRCATEFGIRQTPSIFMPRWVSRITLEVVNVRVERLQEISEADAIAEGVYTNEQALQKLGLPPGTELQGTCVDKYRIVWDSINGKKYPWASNPWVWVVEFKKVV